MPVVQVSLARGRSPEALAELGKQITRAVEQSISARSETVRVLITEVEPEHWFVGGQTLAER